MSESEEMYLITIAGLSEQEPGMPVPLSHLAAQLAVQTVSANQMIRKLADAALVHYEPYKGVSLTETGWQQAWHVLRHRRLWEVFLVEKLHLSLEEADALACRLEHLTPVEVADKLSDFLGHPTLSPQGKPIPVAEAVRPTPTQPLATLAAGQTAHIAAWDIPLPAQKFLESEGLRPGVEITVLGTGSTGAMLLSTNGHQIHLDATLTETILVQIPNS
ncbi:MAG TPA: metal-dependent transcriptional regulator [Anaerolineales bacterium]|nr:metal-dependent transcriptional regulator [Anaerolineales bacterium]